MLFAIGWKPSASSKGAFSRTLAKPGRAVSAFVKIAPEIAHRNYVEYIESMFAEEGVPPWLSLAVPTIIQRLYLGFPPEHPILYRTGSFKESFLGGGVVEQIPLGANSFTLRFGTSDPRFIWHQEGTRFMPARPIAPVGPRYREALAEAIEGDLVFQLAELVRGG